MASLKDVERLADDLEGLVGDLRSELSNGTDFELSEFCGTKKSTSTGLSRGSKFSSFMYGMKGCASTRTFGLGGDTASMTSSPSQR